MSQCRRRRLRRRRRRRRCRRRRRHLLAPRLGHLRLLRWRNLSLVIVHGHLCVTSSWIVFWEHSITARNLQAGWSVESKISHIVVHLVLTDLLCLILLSTKLIVCEQVLEV